MLARGGRTAGRPVCMVVVVEVLLCSGGVCGGVSPVCTCALLCLPAHSSNLPLSDYAVALVLSERTPDLCIISI